MSCKGMNGWKDRERNENKRAEQKRQKWFCTGTEKRCDIYRNKKKNETRMRKLSLLGTLLEKIRGVERFGKKRVTERKREYCVCVLR